jgi:dTDP-4-dehydrorhamnose 3,5-epimerase
MKVSETTLPDVRLVEPVRHEDSRGNFAVIWNERQAAAAGLGRCVLQINESHSASVGTVRGLHFQSPPFAQAKLVRVLRGRILDVAVDIRRGSQHYGRWVGVELSASVGAMLNVPRGFLHGFVTREPDTVVSYLVDNAYDRASEGSVRYDDPDLGIDWGLSPDQAVLSEKDAAALSFAAFDSPFVFGEIE